ncbi:MAG: class I SAM-dependent methyltransferase [Treponema sp.]|jgi:SAM-dependent methyltransferase|nr:class I SAM-dependent methyltransferase [Treponema sp.]
MMALKTWSTPVEAQDYRPLPCPLCGGRDFRPRLFCEGFSYAACRVCGLVQMNPQPSPEDIRRRYGEDHGRDYLAYEISREAPFLRLQMLGLEDAGFFDWEAELLAAGEAPSVLDLGCATGALLTELKRRGWKTTGAELSGPQAGYARSRGLDVRTGTLEEQRFPDSSFQAILASHLIEHLNDPRTFVREVYRILEQGGRFLVTTPNIAGFQARLFGGRWRSAIFDHLFLFSKKTLSTLLVQSGFSIERILTWGGLAAGTVPAPIKARADSAAKRFGFGDVMLIRAMKRGKAGSR